MTSRVEEPTRHLYAYDELVLTVEELEELLDVGYETRSFEVKGPGDLKDKEFVAKVARAAMAVGNLSGMGYVCIGIDEKQMQDHQPGLNEARFDQWSDFDYVSAALARYSDPPVAFDLNPLVLNNGNRVVVLEIDEFDDVPYVCKRDYPGVLQAGQIYVRPRGMPKSVPVPNASELRELLDLAAGKRFRDLLRRVGVQLPSTESVEQQDQDQFQAEARQVWSVASSTVDDITSRSYFDVSVHPSTFDPQLLDVGELYEFVVDNTVRMRGWPVPFTGTGATLQRHATWVGEESAMMGGRREEVWRMCTSGQFLHRRLLSNERRDTADRPEVQPTLASATGSVVLWDVLLYAVEVAEFAAKVAGALNQDSVSVGMAVRGIAGRQLVSGDWKRELHDAYIYSGDDIGTNLTFSTPGLLARPREAGVQVTQRLIKPFGLNVPDQVLIDWQDQVFSRH